MWSKIKELGKKIISSPISFIIIGAISFLIGLNVLGFLTTGVYVGSLLFKSEECKGECKCKSEDI